MAAGQHRAKIEIEAKVAGAVKKIDQLEKKIQRLEKQTTKTAKASRDAQKALEGMLTGAAIVQGVRTMDDLVNRSIAYENVMANLPFSIDAARRSTKGLITDFDLAKSAVAAHALGITKTSAEYAKFSEAAVKLGSKLGIDTAQAMDQLTAAVGRGSAKILDNFGIMAKGFESMSMEDRLALISNAVDDTSFSVSKGAQSWAQMKNELDNLLNQSLPLFADLAGFAANQIKNLSDDVKGLNEALGESGFQWGNMIPTMQESLDLWIELQKPILGVGGYLDSFVSSADAATVSIRNQAAAVRELGNDFKGMFGKSKRDMTKEEEEAFDKTFGIDQGEDFLLQGPLLGANASDFTGNKGRGSRKKRVDPSRRDRSAGGSGQDLGAAIAFGAAEISEKNTAADMERDLELMRARQDSTEDLFDKEIELAQFRGDAHGAEVLRLEKEVALREEREKKEVEFAKAEKKRIAELTRMRRQTASAVMGLADTTAQAIQMAAEKSGASEEKVAKIAAFAKGMKAMATGAQVTAEGIADIASQNYLKGFAEISAGAINFIVGGMLMSGDVNSAAGAVGGGGAGGAGQQTGVGAGGRGFGGASFASGGSGGGNRSTGGGGSDIPPSPNGIPPGGAANGGNGGSQPAPQINVLHIGKIDREAATTLQQGLDDLRHSNGRVA